MKKSKLIVYLIFMVAIAVAPNAYAGVQGSLGPETNTTFADPVRTGGLMTVNMTGTNNSTNTSGGIDVYLRGQVVEFDACLDTPCGNYNGVDFGNEVPGTFEFVPVPATTHCEEVNPCINPGTCQNNPFVAYGGLQNSVSFTVAEKCLVMPYGVAVPLVNITKLALSPPVGAFDPCHIFAHAASLKNGLVDASTCGYASTGNPAGCSTGFAGGSDDVFYCASPKIVVTKDCLAPQCFPGAIDFGGSICNTGDEDLDNLQFTDNKGTIDPTKGWDNLTYPICVIGQTLAVDECCQYAGSYTPGASGSSTDEVTGSGTGAISGNTVTDKATATCSEAPGVPGATCEKTGTCPQTPEGEATYTLEFCADNIGNCPADLKNCKIIDNATANGAPAVIDYTPVAGNPVNALPNDNIPFDLAPGQCIKFTGSYSAPCPHDAIEVINNAKIVCDNATAPIAPKTCTKTCVIPKCETPEACWLTGGGVKFEPIVGARLATANKGNNGPVISMGGNVNPGCSPTAGDGGNWNIIDHQAKLHFQGRHIEVVECGNIPESIRPPGSDSPKTPFNYIEFKGTGIMKGIGGNKADYGDVCFYARAEDRNEPGSKETLGPALIDRFWIRVDDCSGNELYRFGNDVPNPDTICGDDAFTCTDTIAITGGNLQLHISSCDKIF